MNGRLFNKTFSTLLQILLTLCYESYLYISDNVFNRNNNALPYCDYSNLSLVRPNSDKYRI